MLRWHLGFCKWDYTPTYRGFDSFVGYYSGAEDYFEHMRSEYCPSSNKKADERDRDLPNEG